ncbi:MAG: hypothetical protein Ta2A_14800 [Treponemataceae bacterium]|nr:MAG: hypothetical protein Ta2A_14800 [Treponemataceae bacterium]
MVNSFFGFVTPSQTPSFMLIYKSECKRNQSRQPQLTCTTSIVRHGCRTTTSGRVCYANSWQHGCCRELYSAISGVHYDDSVPLTINTLSDVLFNSRKNDISFLLDEKIVILIEHQSTINENMALRFLIYIARIYEKLVDNESLYRRKQVPIPQPEFIVLYNGTEDYPDYSEMKLSDAFIKAGIEKPALDLTVKIYNINTGKNLPLLQKSKSLNDYAAFTAKVREFQAELKGNFDSKQALEEALKKAIQWCVKQNILKHFLQENGSEVENMVFGEWDMSVALSGKRRRLGRWHGSRHRKGHGGRHREGHGGRHREGHGERFGAS